MKKITLLLLCLIASVSFLAQTISSAASGNWNDTSTWVGGVVPTITDDVSVIHNVIIRPGESAFAKSISGLGSNQQVRIQEGANLTVDGNITIARSLNGIYFEYSDLSTPVTKDVGTLIYGGTVTVGKRFFVRKLLPTNDDWHLVSVGGRATRISKMTGSGILVENATDNIFSMASYNGANAAGSKYEYYAIDGTYGNADYFDHSGYSVKVNNTNNPVRPFVSYEPLFYDTDITEDISDAGDGFNLLGNNFLAYIHANSAADATNNLLTVNSTVLDEQTLWFWDNAKSGGAGWVTINNSDAAYRVAPVQGFFVKAKAGGGTAQSFSFTKAMETHTKAGDYYKTANDRFEVDLFVASGKLKTNTAIRYIDNTTISFDNGYDSSVFGGYTSALEIYTGLTDGSSAKKLAIQSLPNSEYETMIVPVGVTATANSEITFSAKALNVPAGLNVYLEDRLNKTFTRLDEAGAEYTTTVTSTATEGRFYMHAKSSSALSTDSELLSSVRIYKKDASTLRITGLPQGAASLSVYNILGKQMMNATFEGKGVNEISLPKLGNGVYIVQLTTDTGKLNMKIILE